MFICGYPRWGCMHRNRHHQQIISLMCIFLRLVSSLLRSNPKAPQIALSIYLARWSMLTRMISVVCDGWIRSRRWAHGMVIHTFRTSHHENGIPDRKRAYSKFFPMYGSMPHGLQLALKSMAAMVHVEGGSKTAHLIIHEPISSSCIKVSGSNP